MSVETFETLDVERKLRLLEMTFVRVTVATVYTTWVGIAILATALFMEYPWEPLAVWTSAFLCMIPSYRRLLRLFQQQLPLKLAEGGSASRAFYRKWFKYVQLMAALLGLLLGMLTFINRDIPSFEFLILLGVIVAIMMATNAAHQTPVLKIYYTYFFIAWGGTTVTLPWVYPEHWFPIFLLALINASAISLDARRVNQFFIRQVALEQRSQILAEEARQAEQTAKHALQSKNEFLATASHDLRQPLHALNLNVEALAQSLSDTSQLSRIQDIQSCARTLTQMFNAILDLSKLEAGQGKIQKGPVNLNALLSDLGRVFTAEAKHKGLEFRLRLPKRVVIIDSDENLLRQIVTNLMQNAIRYTPAGSILLALRTHPVARIDVMDTGIGIAEADQSRIHQPFYRAKVGFSDSLSSHGLGLAVVSRCVRLLEAKHGFRSAPGRGSHFWVSFPPSTTGEHAELLPPLPERASAPLRDTLLGDRCLILEDDPMVAKSWQNFLELTGLQIEIVEDHATLHAVLDRGYEPEYVLCDLRLRSGDNGYTLLRQIMERRPQASYAMISGELNALELAEAADEGIPVFQKPVAPEELVKLLQLWRSMRASTLPQ